MLPTVEAVITIEQSSIGQTVEAQQRLIDLADTYPNSEYAPISLYEAACNAEFRGISTAYQEAVARLERLIQSYPNSELVYYARLKQADLARKLNDFGAAQNIYESLLIDAPTHPSRPRTELSRADCFLAMGGQNPMRFADAIAIYERLVDLPDTSADLRIEAGYKWGYACTRQNNLERAEEVFWILINQFLDKEMGVEQLQSQGRYWLSRSLFELGEIFEKKNRFEDARKIYLRIQDFSLPGQALATAKLNVPFSEQ